MSTKVEALLHGYDSLTNLEKHEAAVEILKRSMAEDYAEVPDSTLVELADELFQALDQAEAKNAQP